MTRKHRSIVGGLLVAAGATALAYVGYRLGESSMKASPPQPDVQGSDLEPVGFLDEVFALVANRLER